MMSLEWQLVFNGLATWRVSNMLVKEEGPYKVFQKLREATGIIHDDEGRVLATPDNNLLSCVWCVSVWIAAISLIVPSWLTRALALSTIVIGLDGAIAETRRWLLWAKIRNP